MLWFSHLDQGHPMQPLPLGFFERIPAEILILVAEKAEQSKTRASICAVNKFCYSTCTTVLYSGQISIYGDRTAERLFRTLIQLRPDMATMVKNLHIAVRVK